MATYDVTEHLIGNAILIGIFGLGVIACFVVAIKMLMRPGEKSKNHPKYRVLNDDR